MCCVERLLPEFDVESRHSIRISAPADKVYAVARRLDVSASWVIRLLFRLRGLPASALNVEGLQRLRFKVLEESPPHCWAMGIVGRFWTLSGQLLDFDPERFADFCEPGYAKAVWSFEIREDCYGATFVETVTRVRCLDPASRRRFLRYWRIVGPFSGLIRGQMLKMLRRQAESSR